MSIIHEGKQSNYISKHHNRQQSKPRGRLTRQNIVGTVPTQMVRVPNFRCTDKFRCTMSNRYTFYRVFWHSYSFFELVEYTSGT